MKQDLWQNVKKKLQIKHSGNDYVETWFKPTELIQVQDVAGQNTRFNLGVPTELHKYWLSEHFLSEIRDSIKELFTEPFELEILVKSDLEKQTPVAVLAKTGLNVIETPSLNQPKSHMTTQNKLRLNSQIRTSADHLNHEYTFSNFVVGRNNEFAHAACHNIAENPKGGDYNPLFICGPTGMGKTHLINAVANHVLEKDSTKIITYVSAEKFLNECVSCLKRLEMHKFRKKYRERSDILLMDDIQILGRGEVIQEEFFHTLNEYLETGRQVVVASDRMPKDIKGFEDRIRTRLEWGLIADIQMPDVETRVAILNYKAEKMHLKLSIDVLNYIARISRRSIRELEGNLNKIKMFSKLQNTKIDLNLCKKVLSYHDSKATVTIDDIIKLISNHYEIKIQDIKGKNRSKNILIARQVGMYLVKKQSDKSLVEIGRIFGGRDHTTVMNALKKIEIHKSENAEIRTDIEDLSRKIHNLTGV